MRKPKRAKAAKAVKAKKPCDHAIGWYVPDGNVQCEQCLRMFTVYDWHDLHHPVKEPTEEEIVDLAERLKKAAYEVPAPHGWRAAAILAWRLGARVPR